MEDKVLIGTIRKVDTDNDFGIVVEDGGQAGSASIGSAFFKPKEMNADLKEGQLVQFVVEQSAAGPQAKRIMVLIDKAADQA